MPSSSLARRTVGPFFVMNLLSAFHTRYPLMQVFLESGNSDVVYNKLLNCFYDVNSNYERIVLNDEQYLTMINKSEKMPVDKKTRIFHQQIASQHENRLKSLDANNNASSNEKSEKMDVDASISSPAPLSHALHISNKYRVSSTKEAIFLQTLKPSKTNEFQQQ